MCLWPSISSSTQISSVSLGSSLRYGPDVTYPGGAGGRSSDGFVRPPCPVQPGDKDVDWIPQAASAGWIIITRDRHIQHRPAERTALVSAGARMFRLDARHGHNKWQQLEIIVTQWRRFE
jgi:hypothetical protein